jgi:hypothetical protein
MFWMKIRENKRTTAYALLAIMSAWLTYIFRPMLPIKGNVDRSRPLFMSNYFVDEYESSGKTILMTDGEKEKLASFASTIVFFKEFLVCTQKKRVFMIFDNGKTTIDSSFNESSGSRTTTLCLS